MTYTKKPGAYARKPFSARGAHGFKRPSYGEATERFQATCNQCHALCEVPFRPNGKKPVYCRACFKGKEEPRTGALRTRDSYAAPGANLSDVAKRLDAIEATLERILDRLG